MSNLLFETLFLGLLLWIQTTWCDLVPRIQLNGYELEPTSIGYTLRITHPNGTGYRNEDVKQLYPGRQLIVEGTVQQEYKGKDGTFGTLMVTYQAGEKGTLVKYIYESADYKKPLVVIKSFRELSVVSLKTAAG